MTAYVLLAEDEPNIVTSLSFVLERAGFEVGVQSDGQQAWAAVLERPPDVMVLDVMMPGLDGYEILRRLRADEKTAHVPVLMLTAKGQREDRRTALECGANKFITKPFANADIIAAVTELAESTAV